MKRKFTSVLAASLMIGLTSLSSCYFNLEDPGPIQEETRSYDVTNFDKLEMGDAFNIYVQQGSTFSVLAKGDQRNLNDMDVYLSGTTLIVKYSNWHNRRHETDITIIMPELSAVNFSGATNAKVSDFETNDRLDVVLSGASTLDLYGIGDFLNADVSGASYLNSYDFYAENVFVNVSGASKAKVFANLELTATASGASTVYYRGNPLVNSSVSGASVVRKE